MNPKNVLLTVTELCKRYGGKVPTDVLKGVSMKIMSGERLAITGHSGVGKSTLLNILGLLDQPDSGSITYTGRDEQLCDHDITVLSQRRKALVRNRHFGFVFQLYHLLPDLNILENIMLPAFIEAGGTGWFGIRDTVKQKAVSLLEKMGIAHRMKARPPELSGGEKQRAAIARALICDPEVLFCDEPTGNLDTATSNKINKLLWKLNRDHKVTMVIVTHEKDLAREADRVLHMVDGRFQS